MNEPLKGFFGWSKWFRTGEKWLDCPSDRVFDSYYQALEFIKTKITPDKEWKPV